MKKIVLAAATAAALTVGGAASAQVLAPWAYGYEPGPVYSEPYAYGHGYSGWRGSIDNETPYFDRRGIYGADR